MGEHKARLAQGSSPAAGKKRVALTPVSQASPTAVKRGRSRPPMANMSPANAKRATLTPVAKVAKKNPIAAMVSDKELNSPQIGNASPIVVKKTPSTATASPICQENSRIRSIQSSSIKEGVANFYS